MHATLSFDGLNVLQRMKSEKIYERAYSIVCENIDCKHFNIQLRYISEFSLFILGYAYEWHCTVSNERDRVRERKSDTDEATALALCI